MSEHTALTAVRWVRSEPHNDLGLWHSRLLARRVRFEQRWAARFFRPDSTAPKKRGPEGLQAEPDKGDGHQVCISVVSAGPKPRPFSEWRKTTISKKPKIDHEYHAGKDKMKITIKGYRAVSLADFVLRLKVDTAQDDAGRSAFELPCQVFASDTLFNPVAQPHECASRWFGMDRATPSRSSMAEVEMAQGISLLPSTIENSMTILSNS